MDAKEMIFYFLILFSIIVLSFFYLSYQIFNLLVEIVKLKKLREVAEKEKRILIIKKKINKSILRKKIKKGRFSSLLNK